MRLHSLRLEFRGGLRYTSTTMSTTLLSLLEAAPFLNRGDVGVLPTDTVYGLVTIARSEQAVTRMYALKSREKKPGTLIAADSSQLEALGVPREELDKISQWWPNPLSAVLPMNGNEYLHQGVGDIAMRVVADPLVRELLLITGPLITSSANLPGEPESKTIDDAEHYFGESVDFYVDGGEISSGVPSTIIRPRNGDIEILRQGSIAIR